MELFDRIVDKIICEKIHLSAHHLVDERSNENKEIFSSNEYFYRYILKEVT